MVQIPTSSPQLNLHATEPYYTMSVWHVEELQMYPGQMYTPHSLNPVLQSCTTPCQFDMWQNADVPRSDIHPSLIEPSATQPYYTRSSLTCGRMETYPDQTYIPPPSIEPSAYRALLHHVSFTCERMQMHTQVRCTLPHSLNPVLQSCTTPCQFDMWTECRCT